MKQIGLGLQMYTQDYDESMPIAFPNIAAINGGGANTVPYDQQLKPYVKNDQVYACPSDAQPRYGGSFWDGSYNGKNLLRSYGYVGRITTTEASTGANGHVAENPDRNTGMSDWGGANQQASLGEITAPAETISIVEMWASPTVDGYVGSWPGALFTGCDTYKLAGRKYPSSAAIDQGPSGCGTFPALPAIGHQNQNNYIFADGHVKVMQWGNIRKNDFYLFKLKKPTVTYTP